MFLLLAWSRECLHEKENWKVFKDDLFNSFCGWFDKQNAKQEFFSLLRHFSKKKGFLRKKSRLVGVRWFLSQMSFSNFKAVSEEDVKQHKYLVKLFQNLKYRPGLINV